VLSHHRQDRRAPRMPRATGSKGSPGNEGLRHRLHRRTLLSVVTACALIVAAAVTVTTSLSEAGPGPLGVFAGWDNVSGVQQLGQSIGQQPAYAMDFLDGTSWQTISNPDAQQIADWAASGYQMIWGIAMLPSSGGSLAAGASGAYDPYFAAAARALVAGGQGSSVIRLGWEFNGDWFPWGVNAGSAADFVAYWRQIVDTMRAVPGANFRFEWNPTRGGSVDLASYYPGDSYVDWIGLDVYDAEWGSYPGAAAEFTNMEQQQYGLDWLAQFSAQHGKRMAFPEWGLGWGPSNNGGPVTAASQQVSGGDDPTFVNDMAAWIASHNVVEATFWDYGTSSLGGGQNPQTLTALGHDFGPGGIASTAGASASSPAAPTAPPTSAPTPPPTPTSPAVVPASGAPSSTATSAPQGPPHVAIITMENLAQSDVLGNPAAPFLNHVAQSGGFAADSYGQDHPSLGNYLAQWFGVAGVTDDSNPPAHEQAGSSIGDELAAAGYSWRAYAEDFSGMTDTSLYAVHHVPQLYSTPDQSGVVDYSQLAAELQAGTAPDLLYIVPNMCDDVHDCPISTGDAWLGAQVGALTGSSWYADDPNASIIITWDEGQSTDSSGFGDANGGRIFTVVISHRPGSTQSTPVDQVGVARSVLECFGVATGIGETGDPSHGDLIGLMSCPGASPAPVLQPNAAQGQGAPPPATTPPPTTLHEGAGATTGDAPGPTALATQAALASGTGASSQGRDLSAPSSTAGGRATSGRGHHRSGHRRGEVRSTLSSKDRSHHRRGRADLATYKGWGRHHSSWGRALVTATTAWSRALAHPATLENTRAR